jgi:hypothetical protein
VSKEVPPHQAIGIDEALDRLDPAEETMVEMSGHDVQEPMGLARFEAAQYWLAQGVHLVPIQPTSKRLVAGFGSYRDHLATEQAARQWFIGTTHNLGVVCGTGTEGQLVVADFDDVQAYERWRAGVGSAAETLTEKTARGVHVFYFSGDAPSGVGQGLEVKGRGAVVMVAPSVHPSGVIYQRVNDLPVARVDSAARLFSLLSDKPEGRFRHESWAAIQENARPAVGDDAVARIKSAVSVRRLASQLTTLQSSDGGKGRWFAGRCPFHDDQHPSFWVDAERGLWGCRTPSCPTNLGGARAHDVINLYARAQDIDEQEAIRRMAADYLSS